MDHREHSDELIELGVASVETRGGDPVALDQFGAGIPTGMSNAD